MTEHLIEIKEVTTKQVIIQIPDNYTFADFYDEIVDDINTGENGMDIDIVNDKHEFYRDWDLIMTGSPESFELLKKHSRLDKDLPIIKYGKESK